MKIRKLSKYLFIILFSTDVNYSVANAQTENLEIKGVVDSKLSINLNQTTDQTFFQSDIFNGDSLTAEFIQNVRSGAYIKFRFLLNNASTNFYNGDQLVYSNFQSTDFSVAEQSSNSYFGEWFTNSIQLISIGFEVNDFQKIVEIRNY